MDNYTNVKNPTLPETGSLAYLKICSADLAIGIFTADSSGLLTSWDRKMEAITGIDAARASGTSLVRNEERNREIFGFRSRTCFAARLTELLRVHTDDPSISPVSTFDWSLKNTAGDDILLKVTLLGRIVDTSHRVEFVFLANDASPAMQRYGWAETPFELLSSSLELSALYRALGNTEQFFIRMLEELLLYSRSEYGFVGEVRFDINGAPYLVTRTLTNISWNIETLEFYNNRPMVFRNLDTLFGSCLKTGELVIANHPATDKRSAGVPHGHPAMDSFIGIPLKANNQLVGMIGLANRPDGYDTRFVDRLEPLLGVCTDVFRDVSISRNLKFIEDKNLVLFNRTPLMHFITRRDESGMAGIILQANETFIDNLMYDSLHVLGHTALEFFSPRSQNKIQDIIRKLESRINESNQHVSSGNEISYTALVDLINGKQVAVPAEATVSLATNSNGEVTGLNVVCRDMSEEISSSLYKARLETEWLSLINNARVGVISIGLDGTISEWNQNMTAITGIEDKDVLGKSYFDFIITESSGDDRKRLELLMSGMENNVSMEVTFRTRSLRTAKMLISAISKRDAAGKISGVRAVGQDLTLLNEQTATIMQAQKMEALGLMAGGLAHDLNNILTIVKGNLELIWSELHENNDVKGMIDDALSSAMDGYDITRQLMAFSRTQPIHKRDIPVNSVVTGFLKILKRSLGKKIELVFTEDSSDPVIRIDANQLETALLNLVLNSRDAIGEKDDGRIVISIEHTHVNSAGSSEPEYLLPGDYIILTVSDNGCGMSPVVRVQALDPYFSTKPVGTGTGFGLSMVHGFTRQNGGGMNIGSLQGKGTSVKLYLPLSSLSRVSPRDISIIDDSVEARDTAGATGIRNVLIVDDNEKVLRVVSKSLRDWGFNTLTAENADQALRTLGRNRDIDLVLSDIVMHGSLSGRELAREISRLYPDMKIILMTGYEPSTKNPENTDTFVLYKPYTREQFFEAINAC